MSAQILDGKAIANEMISEIAKVVNIRQQEGKRSPGLAVVLVGDHAASAVYVRNKKRACEAAGIRSISHDLPASISEESLLTLIKELNQDTSVDGILVQLPLPPHLDADKVLALIDPSKDVDGFHPYNIGRLALKMPGLRPCTPYGVMTLLEKTGIEIKGKDAVVVGASNIVGRPMMLELLLAHATVTICHSQTQDLEKKIRAADIVVVGIGRPNFIPGAWIKPNAVVIDVGINRLADGSLCGDVDFQAAKEHASWITPVPGGVGPMTVAVLMQNTLTAAQYFNP